MRKLIFAFSCAAVAGQMTLLLILTAIPASSQKVAPDIQAENLASCALEVQAQSALPPGTDPPTPYGFAKDMLVSLWYAKTAANRGDEIKKVAKECDNMLSLMTGMMRV